ncbi:hypothetical protein [Actinophytocola sp.]|uniref:hypothetical protein n=1 Tax=Actinophytocola sp. TaxID=1872138 RepID=UPI0025B8FC96|nr:hypothetical protein [Actinophytocola sp.]
MTVRRPTLMLCVTLLLHVGCSPTNGEPAQEPPATTPTTTAPSDGIRPECTGVADRARTLVTEVGRLATGDATADQVSAAAGELSDAFDAARDAVEPDARAGLDEAGQALDRVQTALTAQPIDTTGLRAAARDLATALGDAASICSPTTGSPSDPPTNTTPPTS